MYILKYSTQKLYSHFTTFLSVSWSLTSSELLTFIVSSTAPEVGMSLFYYFFPIYFSFQQCIPVSVWLSWNMARLHVAWGSSAGLDFFCVQVIYVIVKIVTSYFHRHSLLRKSLVGKCTGYEIFNRKESLMFKYGRMQTKISSQLV